MRLHIAAIGKARRDAHEQKCALEFLARIHANHRGMLTEYVSKKSEGAARIEDESRLIMESLPEHAVLIALDATGEDMPSQALAALIRKYRDASRRDAVFAIGGAYGHDAALLSRADHIIAFGRATWPHLLCRAMLAEQLYRAEMILANHPYHHG